jgi:hypothetical protein
MPTNVVPVPEETLSAITCVSADSNDKVTKLSGNSVMVNGVAKWTASHRLQFGYVQNSNDSYSLGRFVITLMKQTINYGSVENHYEMSRVAYDKTIGIIRSEAQAIGTNTDPFSSITNPGVYKRDYAPTNSTASREAAMIVTEFNVTNPGVYFLEFQYVPEPDASGFMYIFPIISWFVVVIYGLVKQVLQRYQTVFQVFRNDTNAYSPMNLLERYQKHSLQPITLPMFLL